MKMLAMGDAVQVHRDPRGTVLRSRVRPKPDVEVGGHRGTLQEASLMMVRALDVTMMLHVLVPRAQWIACPNQHRIHSRPLNRNLTLEDKSRLESGNLLCLVVVVREKRMNARKNGYVVHDILP